MASVAQQKMEALQKQENEILREMIREVVREEIINALKDPEVQERFATPEQFLASAEKIFKTHKKVLDALA